MFENLVTSKRNKLHAAITVATIMLSSGSAIAKTYWETVVDNAAVVIDTSLGNLTAQQEVQKLNENWHKWRVSSVLPSGQIEIDGAYPVLTYQPSEIGRTLGLSYFFLDPATGQRISAPVQIASVRYGAILTPPTLVKSDLSEAFIRQHITILGTSTDALNGFAFQTQLQGFEPMFFGFAFDAAGVEYTQERIAGFASTVAVPEPSQQVLLLSGLIALFSGRAIRRRKLGRLSEKCEPSQIR